MKYLSILLFMLSSSICSAAGDISGTIDILQVNVDAATNSDMVVVKFNTIPTNRPACATDTQGRMQTSLETEGGKAFYSLMLAAKASGATVNVIGTGTCIGSLEKVHLGRLE